MIWAMHFIRNSLPILDDFFNLPTFIFLLESLPKIKHLGIYIYIYIYMILPKGGGYL